MCTHVSRFSFPMTPIDLYVQGTPPGYAILVAGPWGSGKSYWWNAYSQTLARFERTPISMSAAGIRTYEDLASALFKASIEDIGTPALREAGKLFGRTLLRYAKVDPNDITLKAETFSGKTVICIDDLERFAGDFKVLFGFIVNLLDRNSVHCILMADEEHAITNFGEDYGTYKERIIGRTVRRKPELQTFVLEVIRGFADADVRSLLESEFENIARQLANWKMYNLRTARHFLSELAAILKQCAPETGSNLAPIISAVAFWAIAEAVDTKNNDRVAKMFVTPSFEIAYNLAQPKSSSDPSSGPSELDEISALIDGLGFSNEVENWPVSKDFSNFILGENVDFNQIAIDVGLHAARNTVPVGHSLVAALNSYRSSSDEDLQNAIRDARAYLASTTETNLSVVFDLFRSIYWLAHSGLTSFAEDEWRDEVLRVIDRMGASLHAGINVDIEYLHGSLDDNEEQVFTALSSLANEVKRLVWTEQLEKFTSAIMTGEGVLPNLVTNAPLFKGKDSEAFYDKLRAAGVPAVRRLGGLLRNSRRVENAGTFAFEDADFYAQLAEVIDSRVSRRRPMTILDSDLCHVANDLQLLATHLRSSRP